MPAVWTIILIVGFASTTINIVLNHPEKVVGWRAPGLIILIICLLTAYRRISWGRIYQDNGISEQQALMLIRLQLLALLFLVRGYDALFAWFSFSVLYQIIGGLSQPRWPLPLIGLLVVFAVSLLPTDGSRTVDIGVIVGATILIAGNIAVALFIQSLGKRHAQLNTMFERLRQAYTALTISTAQAEELAVLRERTRLARAMHDEIGHALVVINVKLEAAQLLYAHDAARGDAELEATRALIRRTMTDLRHTLANLRAPVVDYDDLPAALQRLAQETQSRTAIAITCCIPAVMTVPPIDARQALWYVAREALTNVEKHALANHVTITFDCHNDQWLLRIEDDGAGIHSLDLETPGHYGVLGMRERMYAIGGTLNILAGGVSGTIVEAYVPIKVRMEAQVL
ncbi:MAG: sensor histidine kinase [Chloroflexota bacterium]